MEEVEAKIEPVSAPEKKDETTKKGDDPPIDAIITLVNQRINDVKTACESSISNLEKKISKQFKISIGVSLAVLIAYTSLPPETLKTLVETICSIFAK